MWKDIIVHSIYQRRGRSRLHLVRLLRSAIAEDLGVRPKATELKRTRRDMYIIHNSQRADKYMGVNPPEAVLGGLVPEATSFLTIFDEHHGCFEWKPHDKRAVVTCNRACISGISTEGTGNWPDSGSPEADLLDGVGLVSLTLTRELY
jgi:hypothetical protein